MIVENILILVNHKSFSPQIFFIRPYGNIFLLNGLILVHNYFPLAVKLYTLGEINGVNLLKGSHGYSVSE